jgi:hypothetical protein
MRLPVFDASGKSDFCRNVPAKMAFFCRRQKPVVCAEKKYGVENAVLKWRRKTETEKDADFFTLALAISKTSLLE